MTGNGRGTMRPQGRAPPFLVIGLLVVLCILGYSYWSVSSTSSERASVIARLQEELQSLSARKLEADKRSSETNTKLDEIVKMKASLETRIAAAEKDAESFRNQANSKNDELLSVQNEFDSKKEALRKCEEDSSGIQQELQKLKEETDSLKQDAENKPAHCDQNACQEPLKNLLNILMNTLGRPQVIASLQNNPEFKNFLPAEGGQNAGENPQVIVNPVNPQQPVVNPQQSAVNQDGQPQPPVNQDGQPQPPVNQDGQPQGGVNQDGQPGDKQEGQAPPAENQDNQQPAANPADQGAVGQVQPPQDLQKTGQQHVDKVDEKSDNIVKADVNGTGSSVVEGNKGLETETQGSEVKKDEVGMEEKKEENKQDDKKEEIKQDKKEEIKQDDKKEIGKEDEKIEAGKEDKTGEKGGISEEKNAANEQNATVKALADLKDDKSGAGDEEKVGEEDKQQEGEEEEEEIDEEENNLKFEPKLPPGDIQKENDAIDRMNENMAMDDRKLPGLP